MSAQPQWTTAPAPEPPVRPAPEARPLWRTVKVRAEDLAEGDVARNRYGKWDRIKEMHFDEDDLRYVRASFECGGDAVFRAVDLRDVQVVKDS